MSANATTPLGRQSNLAMSIPPAPRRGLVVLLLLVLWVPAGAGGQSLDFLSFDTGFGWLGLSELDDLAPRGGASVVLGASFMSFSPDSYFGIGANLALLAWGGGGTAQIEFGPGGVGDSSLHSPYFGLRLGMGSGTYTKETFADLYGGVYEVDNEISGLAGALVVGFRAVFAGFGLNVDAAPGIFYVTEQDPEVTEAEVDDYLGFLEVRVGFSYALPLG